MTDRICSKIQEFALNHLEILGVFLFGSYAKNQARESSDVDVAIYVDPDVGRGSTLDLRLRYTVELETAIGKQVDVIILNQAPPILRHQVFRHGILIYERDPARVRRFVGNALTEFYDEIVSLDAAQKTLIRRHLLGRS